MNCERVGAERGAHGLERLGDLERVASYVDGDAARLRDVPGLGEEAVGDVDQGGGPGLRGLLARGVRRLRPAVGLDQHPRRAEAAAEDREPAGGPPLPAGERQHVAGLGARAQHRAPGCTGRAR